ncbi:MAG: hypothetical protein JJE25_04725 [Bacteroidia bacterium]|nr:hypothetical protein [Bacteroidia bacterium]
MMKKKDFIEIGFIRKTNGFKGEIILAVHNGRTEDFSKTKFLFIDMNGSIVPFLVKHFSDESGKAVIMFEDINSHDAAVDLVSRKVFLPVKEFPKKYSTEDELKTLNGYSVIDEERGLLGTVKEVSEMHGQLVISFQYQGVDVLLPLHDETLLKILKKKKELHVKLPDGLLEVYTSGRKK